MFSSLLHPRRLRRLARDDSGVAIVEFALIVPLFFSLIFGMLDFGRAFNYWIDATHLANMAARQAAVNNNPGKGRTTASGQPMTLQLWAKSLANTKEFRDGGTDSVPAPGTTVCIRFPSGGTPKVGDPVEAKVKATYRWLSILELPVSTTLSGSATMRTEVAPTADQWTPDATC